MSTPTIASPALLDSYAAPRATTRRTWMVLLGILSVGFVLRLAVLISVAHVDLFIDDEKHYTELASNLAAGHGFSWTALGPTSVRPPLYPAFIASVWSVWGANSYQAVRFVQIFLSLGTIALVFLIARRLYDERIALLSAALWGVYPSFLYAGGLLLTEVLFTTLLLGGVLLAIESLPQGRSAWRAAASGLLIGLAALTRSVLWPFPVVLSLAALVFLRRTPRRAVTLCALFCAGFAVVVAPWAIRNTRLQGVPTMVDTMGGLNLRMGNFEYTLEDRMWDGVSLKGDKAWAHQMFVEHPDAVRWTEGQKDKWAQRKAFEYMAAHPGTTIRRSLLKFADFWGLEREYIAALSKGQYSPPAWFAALSSGLILVVYPLIVLFAVAGILLATPSDRAAHGLLLLVVLFVCGIHTIVFGHSRYHLPLMPFLVMYAAAALLRVRWEPMTITQRAAVAAGSVACAAIWAREILFRDADKIAAFLHRLS